MDGWNWSYESSDNCFSLLCIIHSFHYLTCKVNGFSLFKLNTHSDTVGPAKDYNWVCISFSKYFTDTFNYLLPQLDCLQQRIVLHAKEFKFLGWLSVIPLEKDQFDLLAQQFRDALALRYRKPLLNLPSTYDGCGASFTVDHALGCCFGGLVILRHNEEWDTVGDLVSLVWNPVRHEPIVKEAGDDEQFALVADLAIHGVWQPQCEAFLISGWWTQTLCYINVVLP